MKIKCKKELWLVEAKGIFRTLKFNPFPEIKGAKISLEFIKGKKYRYRKQGSGFYITGESGTEYSFNLELSIAILAKAFDYQPK